jgi:hypothetical protein
LPVSTELQRAVTLDEKADFAIPQDLGKLIDPEQETSSEAVEAPPAPKRLSDASPKQKAVAVISEAERDKIVDLMEDNGVPTEAMNEYLKEKFGVVGIAGIAQKDYAEVCHWILNGPEIAFGE